MGVKEEDMKSDNMIKWQTVLTGLIIVLFQIALGIWLFNGHWTGLLRYTHANSSVVINDEDQRPMSIGAVLSRLHPPKVDEDDFRYEVEQPQNMMVEKFHNHPDMVLQKLSLVVDHEQKK